MLKKILILALTLSTVACTGKLQENSFISQDKAVNLYQSAELQEWQSRFPEHKLKPLTLTTKSDGTRLRGLLLDSPDSHDAIFYIPGNGMKVSQGGIVALESLASLNRDLIIFDRRGLGASAGKASIKNLISDAREQLDYIKKDLAANTVLVHGFSLGSFVAAQLAKEEEIDALVLQGAATNVYEWIHASTPWYIKPFLTLEIDDAFRSVDNKEVVAKHYTGPLLVIGGEEDEQVPASLSVSLFDASQSTDKVLLMVKGADHASMLKKRQEINAYGRFLASLQ